MDCYKTQVVYMAAENTPMREGDWEDRSIRCMHLDPAALIASCQLEDLSATILQFSIGSAGHPLKPWPAPSRYVPKCRKMKIHQENIKY